MSAYGRFAPGTLVTVPVTGSYGMQVGDVGKLIACTTGATDATVTLASAAAAGANAIVYIQKADTGDVPVTGAANNGVGLVRLTFGTGPTITTNNVNLIEAVLGTAEANGTYALTSISATTADLQGSTFVNTYVSGGFIRGGKVIVTDGVTTFANLFQQSDIVCLISNGATWSELSHGIAPWWFRYRAAATPTWTPPPLATNYYARVTGGGGGGGSGRRGLTLTARSGGTGANPGIFNDDWFTASQIGTAAITFTVGGGGGGGVAIAVDSTDGNPGTNGSTSSIPGFLAAGGGTAGKAGTALAVTSPSSQATIGKYQPPVVGGGTSITGGATAGAANAVGPGSAGAGGSFSTANTEEAPANGGAGYRIGSTPAQGAAGVAPAAGSGSPGGPGGWAATPQGFGGGGAGAATNGSGVAPAGGAGGGPGGAGGGGAASLNGANSGTGGAGAPGAVDIQAWF